MVQGGQIPDVVEMPERWLSLYASNGQLESLEPWLAKWEDTASSPTARWSSAAWSRTRPT